MVKLIRISMRKLPYNRTREVLSLFQVAMRFNEPICKEKANELFREARSNGYLGNSKVKSYKMADKQKVLCLEINIPVGEYHNIKSELAQKLQKICQTIICTN